MYDEKDGYMEKLISVIVPIYNVEKYLSKCIDSILAQTYKNIEIILVDDESPDECSRICDEYKKREHRIKVIHKKNGGLSDARNAGLKIAMGDYIGFVDSDDYIDKDMYQVLIDNINSYDSDISACSVKKFYEDDDITKNKIENKDIYLFNGEEALKDLIEEGMLKQTVWNKLYKKDVIEDIYFEVGKIHEDEFWTYQIFGKSSKIVYTDEKLYYYLQRSGSIMDKQFSEQRLDGLEARYNRLNYIKQKYSKLELEAKMSVFFSCIYQYQCMLRSIKYNDRKYYKLILNKYINYIYFNSDEKDRISFKNRIWIKLANISLDLTCRIRNVIKVGL